MDCSDEIWDWEALQEGELTGFPKPLKEWPEGKTVAQSEEQNVHPTGSHRVAFVLSRKIEYPPDIHNLKAYYISEEMERRGVEVSWIQLGGQEKRWSRDGIRFVGLRAPGRGPFPEAFQLLRLVLYCVLCRTELVYVDEWLFLRKKPWARLVGQMILRAFGLKLVLDQRDPYVDWEIASGELKEETREYKRLSRMRSLLLRQTDLIILPSEAYAALYESEGIPRRKVFGLFRGIDPNLFKLRTESSEIRSRLGLDGSLVIGWFGLMHSYRMIKEIIAPLIGKMSSDLPGAHFLIGGEGPLLSEFERLQQSEARNSFTMLGKIPYEKLPDYIAACDVTICPVSTEFRFTLHSNWLKIPESVSVGTPIIATRTGISALDYRDVKGVIWVDSDYQSFLGALRSVQKDPEFFRAEAREQARHFDAYSIGYTIPRIVDRVLALIKS